jgi:hypothetical protein
MKGKETKKNAQEPVGIVISGMQRVPQPTVFSAYEWSPAPASSEDMKPKAA